MGRNRIIGNGGKLPWRMPSDLRRFKEITMGKPVVMGRATFESIGHPLPGRQTIVVTRNFMFSRPGVTVANDILTALHIASNTRLSMGASEVIVAGGAQIYQQALPHVSAIDLTRIDLMPEGDVLFPVIDPTVWTLSSYE